MGRLPLNEHLNFARCEPEDTAERVFDHVIASKVKVLWIGDKAPLVFDPSPDKKCGKRKSVRDKDCSPNT